MGLLYAVLAALLMSTGGFLWGCSNGEDRGYEKAKVDYDKQISALRADVDKKNKQIEDAAAEKLKEREAGKKEAVHEYSTQVEAIAGERDVALARFNKQRAELVRLRNQRTPATGPDSCPTGGPPSAERGGDEAEEGRLFTACGRFLIGLASEANEVVKQLQLCQREGSAP